MSVRLLFLILIFLPFKHNAMAEELSSDALMCSAIFYIATTKPEFEQMTNVVIQMRGIYGEHLRSESGKLVSRNETDIAQNDVLMSLGEIYDTKPDEVTPIYVRCELWYYMIYEYYSSINFQESYEGMSEEELTTALLNVPTFPRTEDVSAFIDDYQPTVLEIFQAWDDKGRMSTYKSSLQLKEMADQIEANRVKEELE